MKYFILYPITFFDIEVSVTKDIFFELVNNISTHYEIIKIKNDFIEKYYYINSYGDRHFIGYRKEF